MTLVLDFNTQSNKTKSRSPPESVIKTLEKLCVPTFPLMYLLTVNVYCNLVLGSRLSQGYFRERYEYINVRAEQWEESEHSSHI